MFTRHSIQRTLKSTLFALLTSVALQPTPAAAQDTPAFKSVHEAAAALNKAVQTDDQAAITRLLGPLASCGDMVQDRADRQRFLEKYREMHRFVKEPNGTTVLYIGAENWPFPVPLISTGGEWRFDVDAGSQEVMFRRVGENETSAIDTGRAVALGTAKAPTESLHGYQFRVLPTSQGNVVIAYPSEYGATGIMTFAVTPTGMVYEKNLGDKTGQVAQDMVRYKPDKSWHKTEQ
jgi:hypothetical protein